MSGLSIPDDATPDDLAAILDRVKFVLEQAKQAYEEAETSIYNHMTASGIREFQIGNTTYYIGADKKTVARKELAGDLLVKCLELCGGDAQETVLMFLSSQPFKHGAFKKLAGESEFKKYFDVQTVESLKEDTPKTKLSQFNPNLMGR